MEDHQTECNLDLVLSPIHPKGVHCGAFVSSGAAYSGSAFSTGGTRSSGGAGNCGACSDSVGNVGSIGSLVCAESVL